MQHGQLSYSDSLLLMHPAVVTPNPPIPASIVSLY